MLTDKIEFMNFDSMTEQAAGQQVSHFKKIIYKNECIPVFVDAPTFMANSNGIKCIYYLAKRLADSGVNIVFLPRNIQGFKKKLPAEFKGIPVWPLWRIQAPATLVCPESAPAKTIKYARKKGIRILWWYLAPHGLLEKPKASPKAGDKIITFSSYVFPEEDCYYFQPPLDPAWCRALATYRPRSDHKETMVGIYCGKGRLRPLPEQLRALLFDSKIKIITRSSPSSRNELFSLLSMIDGLITYDELSQLTLEAATLGIPVLLANPLFPPKCLNLFSISISTFVTRDPEEFLSLLSERRQGLLKAVSSSSIFSENADTLDRFSRLVLSKTWNYTGEDKLRMQSIFRYGRMLRSKRAIYPHYGGQSAGTFFLAFYMRSLLERPFIYQQICHIISFVDEIGRFFFLAGAGKLFDFIASRLLRSKSLRKGSKLFRGLDK